MKKFLLLTLISLMAIEGFSQRWKATRHEVFGGIGGSNFIGELGGADQDGALKFVRNLNFTDTRYAIHMGYRYQLNELFFFKASLIHGMLSGDDAKTDNIYRNTRNLSFRAPVYEFTANFEFYFLPEKSGQVFKFKGVKNSFLNHLSGYIFAGVGGLHFNPQAELNGKWHNLQPLGTEGQGLRPGTEPYSLFTVVVPYGAGFKYYVNKQWGIGFEYGSRLTFTDYLDDVSTDYYDNNLLRQARGDIAADIADRNPYPERASWTGADQQRGNPESNDFYLFGTFTVYYKFLKGRKIKPRF